MTLDKFKIIGVIGSGAMGSGIAQVAATAGLSVKIFDNQEGALQRSASNLNYNLEKLVEKQKLSTIQQQSILQKTIYVNSLDQLHDCDLVIEAIVENLDIKKKLFSELEKIVKADTILASNTSSLSITSIAAACKQPEKVLGIHFFNPATLMQLVEIIPGIATRSETVTACQSLIESWGKTTVSAKDTPGFIVNRVARPFYSEALRIYEEGIADIPTIDWAMKNIGNFRMGPFELMDLIGHDVNYVVTETVWTQFYFDPKFKPALSQKRLVEAGFLGKKSGRGFYNYGPDNKTQEARENITLGNLIFNRILVMLINEAADTLYLNIATREDIDLAMTKGVNYPYGLLKWADQIGIDNVVAQLNTLKEFYEEDRYRISPILKQMKREKRNFY